MLTTNPITKFMIGSVTGLLWVSRPSDKLLESQMDDKILEYYKDWRELSWLLVPITSLVFRYEIRDWGLFKTGNIYVHGEKEKALKCVGVLGSWYFFNLNRSQTSAEN